MIRSLKDIKKIAVLGAGTMGPGIAQMFAIGGYSVTMWTRSEETREKAKAALLKSIVTFAEEGLIPTDQIDDVFAHVTFAPTVEEAVAGADLIQETIVENKDAKTELYKTLLTAAPRDSIIASNTSALNVFELVPEALLPRMVIAHWYAPAQLIPLVEVVKSEKAPQKLADITVALLEKCGKTPVLMKKFIQGYIANRMQMCLNQEVFHLLDNGYCTPEDIDKAVKASFIPRAVVLGLCKRADFGGLDMTANNYKNKSYVPPAPVDMPKTLAAHVDRGELGLKSGKGFYDYTGVDKGKLIAKRDKQLFEVFKLSKKFMDDPV
ncbi:MAG: 3-hydroxyacyl-CoA dehydrogenase family protein [Oscillospiraceae bacterium]|jgi:3-hydroxyacyl-CoA dehydrogenase|nr:3-hydroxyacyl-CoA dehydrogenase family protein [Oscillospiraceae bacterium]